MKMPQKQEGKRRPEVGVRFASLAAAQAAHGSVQEGAARGPRLRMRLQGLQDRGDRPVQIQALGAAAQAGRAEVFSQEGKEEL